MDYVQLTGVTSIVAAIASLATAIIMIGTWAFDKKTAKHDAIMSAIKDLSDKTDIKFEKIEGSIRELSDKTDLRFEKIEGSIRELSDKTDLRFEKIESMLYQIGTEVACLKGSKEEANRRDALEISHVEMEKRENKLIPKISKKRGRFVR